MRMRKLIGQTCPLIFPTGNRIHGGGSISTGFAVVQKRKLSGHGNAVVDNEIPDRIRTDMIAAVPLEIPVGVNVLPVDLSLRRHRTDEIAASFRLSVIDDSGSVMIPAEMGDPLVRITRQNRRGYCGPGVENESIRLPVRPLPLFAPAVEFRSAAFHDPELRLHRIRKNVSLAPGMKVERTQILSIQPDGLIEHRPLRILPAVLLQRFRVFTENEELPVGGENRSGDTPAGRFFRDRLPHGVAVEVDQSQLPAALSGNCDLSMTQGRGKFMAELARYEEVPAPEAEKIIKARAEEKQ